MAKRQPLGGVAQVVDLDSKRKPVMATETERADSLLRLPVSRPPALAPEPVDVSRVLGRSPRDWEAYLIIEARQQARARELRLFAGLLTETEHAGDSWTL